MQKMKLITQRKQAYFHPPEQNKYCSGAKKVFEDDYEDDGYNFIEWNAQASDLPIEKIKLLALVPGKPQLKKAVFPDYVSELSSLEHIVFDISFLKNKQAEKLPASLRSLILSRNLAYLDVLKDLVKNKIEWDESVRLEKLEALLINAEEEKDEITSRISQENFPELKYLGFRFTDKSELNVFKRFSKLSDLELRDLRDYPIFEHIEHLPLISLDITGANNKFELSGIKNIETLKYLRLNGIRAEIDCQIFTDLPDLTELVILNSKKILNIEALLDCKNLVNISFLDCGNPFKKGVGDKFKERNYEMLDIKYA